MIAVTSAIARAMLAANVYQCVKPPRNQRGLVDDPVRYRFRQVRFSATQKICGEAAFFILLFFVILNFSTGALTPGTKKHANERGNEPATAAIASICNRRRKRNRL